MGRRAGLAGSQWAWQLMQGVVKGPLDTDVTDLAREILLALWLLYDKHPRLFHHNCCLGW